MRVFAALGLLVLTLGGCVAAPPEPIDEPVVELSADAKQRQDVAALDPFVISGPAVLKVTGPSFRAIPLTATEPFSVTRTLCHDPDDGCGAWGFILLPDRAADADPTGNTTCGPLPSELRHWFSQMESYNVFWPDLPASRYVLYYWSAKGDSYLEINDADYEARPPSSAGSVDISALYGVESKDAMTVTGPGAPSTFDAVAEMEPGKTSLLLGRASAFFIGPPDGVEITGALSSGESPCAEASGDDASLPLLATAEARLSGHVASGHPASWHVSAKASLAADARGSASVIAIEASDAVARPFWL